ncbi:MAG: TrmB family transcriptional regulator [Candidatus Woesearchaeota archaeon]|nr:MAG: TrmB family transcriptional regulator [Candidatus Woesearchaeota archaeon]
MIVKEDFLNKLRQTFNLNIYEVKIWTALLSRGVSTAGELSDISDVPRSRSYDVLESLEKKGFIIMKLGKPIQYLAVTPEDIMKRIKKKVQEDSVEQLVMLEKIKNDEVFSELNLLYTQGINFIEPTELSGAFRGRTNLYGHIENVVANAKESVTIVTTADGLNRKSDLLKGLLRRLKDKGVKVRVAAPVNKVSLKGAKTLSEVADVRHVEKLNARYIIVDGKQLVFMVMNDKSVHENYDVGIWAKTPFFAQALEGMLDNSWDSLPKWNKVKVK